MTQTRAFLAVGVALLGFVVMCAFAIELRWLSAGATFTTSVVVAAGVLLGRDCPQEFKVVAAIAAPLAILAVFFEHPAFDQDRVRAHAGFAQAFNQMPLFCPTMTQQQHLSRLKGIEACARQGYSAEAAALVELAKARELPPLAALIDQTHSAFAESDDDRCANAATVGRTICPIAFDAVGSANIAQQP